MSTWSLGEHVVSASIPSFEFATATRIVFGAGKAVQLPDHARELQAEHVLLVTGRDPARAEACDRALREVGISVDLLRAAGEPSVERVREAARALRSSRAQAVIAIGGGSVIDTGKALAALAANDGDVLDYLEVIGRGQALAHRSLPFIAVPTTAGTGAEVTRNAVLGSEEHRVKVSLRSAHMLPRVALVDPDLLQGAPPAVLRSSGLDALSQLIEPFLSARANPVTDALARTGMACSARSLRKAVLQGADAEARSDLALASLCGGLCLANAGLGAVHGFAGPVGGMFDAPHGAVCAALLPHVLELNLRALEARAADNPALARLHHLGPLLTGDANADARAAIAWVRALCAALEVPGLASYGMQESDVSVLVTKAKAASSMRANPLPLQDDELAEIAVRALHPIAKDA